MKIYISSTQRDLVEHRDRVAHVLRQVDHTVLYMEEYTAQESRPLARCVEHVGEADIYVGIFAWRYGHIPKNRITKGPDDLPPDVNPGTTSITEAEYHAAGAKQKPRLIFLLSEQTPWKPLDMDYHTGEGEQGQRISELRGLLAEHHIVAFFSTPEDLANAVLTAVRREELKRKLDLQSLDRVNASDIMMETPGGVPPPLEATTLSTIRDEVMKLDDETYMVVDIGNGRTWWSTRLYFLASLLVDFSEVRLLVFIDQDEALFGGANAVSVRNTLARRIREIQLYEAKINEVSQQSDLHAELKRRSYVWKEVMEKDGGEDKVKTWVRKQELRRYLGDSLVQRSVEWPVEDDGRERALEVVDQVIKWPNDLVPIIRDEKFYKIVERDALTEEVAKIFVEDRTRSGFQQR